MKLALVVFALALSSLAHADLLRSQDGDFPGDIYVVDPATGLTNRVDQQIGLEFKFLGGFLVIGNDNQYYAINPATGKPNRVDQQVGLKLKPMGENVMQAKTGELYVVNPATGKVSRVNDQVANKFVVIPPSTR